MPISPCPTGCGRHRAQGQYLCRTCWFQLTVDARRQLNRRGAGAIDRYLALIDQINSGTPLRDIRIQ